jgi:ATP-dependent Zn protease
LLEEDICELMDDYFDKKKDEEVKDNYVKNVVEKKIEKKGKVKYNKEIHDKEKNRELIFNITGNELNNSSDKNNEFNIWNGFEKQNVWIGSFKRQVAFFIFFILFFIFLTCF